MTAWPHARRRAGVVAVVAERVGTWLLEPAERGTRNAAPRPAEPDVPERHVVAVIGLAPRCGATSVARALGAELARRDPRGAALVSAGAPGRQSLLATPSARRLARSLPAWDREAAPVPAGRLCLVPNSSPAVVRELADRRPAPLVLDVAHGTAPEPALAIADRALLVTTPDVVTALAEVVAASLATRGAAPLVVVNRCVEAAEPPEPRTKLLPESRLAARVAAAGRDPIGPFGSAVAALADALR